MSITKRQLIRDMGVVGAMISMPATGFAQRASGGPAVAIALRTNAGPVRKAAQDLAADLEKVLGSRPTFATSDTATDGLTIVVETRGTGAPETFSLRRQGNRITLSGADMRGTIYAIYHFCQEHLGVDPMYFWTDSLPQPRTAIDMPDGTEHHSARPVFEYRGFFINDEDQLTGWTPAKPGQQTNIDPATMDRVYETLLRLKANMVVPSTWPFPDDLQIRAASARGLIVNQHHATPVGMNAVRWPKDVPYNFTEHPDILRRAWTNSVALYEPDQEILWTVGLRGLSDMPYSELDPAVAGDDAKMGAVIGQAIDEQMQIVRKRFPNAAFVTNLWSEGANLMRNGHLKIPPEVITAWPDTGYGFIMDQGQVRKGQGFYYHVAMLNGRANQLSEMVPVERIHAEFGRFIAAGATRFALVNVSDIRAVAMTAKTTMELAWAGLPQRAQPRDTYRRWSQAQFGTGAAERMADFYTAYFGAFPRTRSQGGHQFELEVGDQHYQHMSRELIVRTMLNPPYYRTFGQSPQWIPPRVGQFGEPDSHAWLDETAAREVSTCQKAAAGWAQLQRRAQAIEAMIPADRRDYWRYAVLTMLSVNANGNGLLLGVGRAVQAVRAGDMAAARRHADSAIAHLAQIERDKGYGTYGKWRHWWRGDWLANTAATGEWLDRFRQWLDDPIKVTPLPMIDIDQKAYYHILGYQGTRSVDVR